MKKFYYSNLPLELTAKKNFVAFKVEHDDDGRLTKRPYNIHTNSFAKSNDSSTWASFNEAVDSYNHKNYDGIGYMFDSDGIVGIDIDHCVKDGEFSELAKSLIAKCRSYAEYSFSMTGVHIFLRDNDAKKIFGSKTGRKFKNGVEIYHTKRFFTLTGKQIEGTPNKIVQNSIVAELVQMFDDKQPQQEKQASPPKSTNLSDNELIAKILSSKQAGLFQKLFYNGDISDYANDDSRADLALMNILAFWTGKNRNQMESIFSMSTLAQREKWQRQDYRNMTIDKAISNVGSIYEPKDNKPAENQKEECSKSYNYETEPVQLPPHIMNLQAELEKIKQSAPPTLTDELVDKFINSDLTDIDCADLFCAVYKNYRYDCSIQTWLKFDGCKWSELEDDKPLRNLWNPLALWAKTQAKINYETMTFENNMKIKLHASFKIKRAKRIVDSILPMLNLRKKKNIIDTVSEYDDIYIKDTEFNKDKYLFNAQNYAINLKTLKLIPHNPYDYCTMVANSSIDEKYFNYLDEGFAGVTKSIGEWDDQFDLTKQCKEWDAFITSAIPDYKTRKILQKYLGYCLSGLTFLKVFFFIHGIADTGKSLLARTIKRILGDYAKIIPMDYLVANRKELNGEEPTPILFNMRHCRLAIASETKENRKLDTAKIKMLTGEDPVTARTLHKPPIEYTPQFKFLFVGNFAPKVDNIYDSGVRTRLRILPFNHVPKKKNTKLDEIFSREENKMAILNWIIRGAFEVMKDIENGINPFDIENLSDEMKKALNKFYDSSDNIPTFFEDEGYQFFATRMFRVKDVWLDYLNWCKTNDERHLRRSDFEEHILTRYKDKGVGIIERTEEHKARMFDGLCKSA